MDKLIRVGIVGGAGYTGGELLRILINHSFAQIAFVHSKSNANKPVSDVHTDLLGDTNLVFCDALHWDIDVLFLCMGHGESKKFLLENTIPAHVRIVDLSQDFRIGQANTNGFVYGLPEAHLADIQRATYIANPGCFATCIQLGLLPLAHAQLLQDAIHINATTGSTGAGQSLSATSHFSWRNNNLSHYKAFEHQHLKEIGANLATLQADLATDIHFIPMRGNFTRGILATIYTPCSKPLDEIKALYQDYYKNSPFVHVSAVAIDLKQVINTNKCLLHIEKHGDMILITSIIDNLLKGASGQAVQNMNLMFGIDQMAGLRLKAVAF